MEINQFLAPAGIGAVSIVVLMIARAVLVRFVQRWSARTASRADDIVLASLKGPSLFWIVAIGLHVGVAFSGLTGKQALYLTRTIHVLLLMSITLAAANLAGRVFKNFIRESALPLPTSGLAYGIMKGAIYAIGALVVLSFLGIPITPLLTALGVGGLAVALALQDTLANLFAGVHILMEKSVRIGDFVRLESGQEGYVQDITWRTTRVRMLPNNMVVIPNSKLAQSVVTNYHLPEQRMSVLIPISVSYGSDPDRLEKVLVEEARKAAGDVPGLLGDPEPFVRFIPGFGENSLDFTLICQVREFVDQYLVQHELRKRIFKRFTAEGIEIPFPQRVVHLRGEHPEKG